MSVTRSSVSERLVMLCVYPGSMWTASILSPLTSKLSTSSESILLCCIRALPLTTMNSSHLELCQCWPLVTPGLEMLTLNWPQHAVLRISVNERSTRS